MATFSQWNKTRPARQLAWVCGPEPALVREVVSCYRDRHEARDIWALFAGSEQDRDIWDELLSSPLLGPRLIIVHEAEKLAGTGPMAALAASPPDGAVTLFVSGEDGFAREADGSTLAPHLAVIQASRGGQLIRCCAPAKAEDAVALVASWWPEASTAHGQRVLRLCGGSLTQAWEACDKASRARLAPDAAAAELVCAPAPGTSFADALIAGDKAAAMTSARQAGRTEVGAGIGLLASRLGMLAVISEQLRSGTHPRELASSGLRVDRYLLRLLAPHAPAYGAERVSRCRELLAAAESAWRRGALAGVAESVIALW